jgi:ubiquinone/menaquinone biosynthesis C-methylase UbiE
MPTLEANLETWNNDYDWSARGDEWSSSWGDAKTQWHGSLYPRIKSFLPAHTILEIAPGFGRWTQFLAENCERLVIVDLSEECIENCKKRFANYKHIEYHINDGKSLAMVEDKSIDFIFSFDSLVHAEIDVIESYIMEFKIKLKENGVAFIHHSNLGSFVGSSNSQQPLLLNKFKGRFFGKKSAPELQRHWRAESVSQDKFSSVCNKNGLSCLVQELVNWGNDPAYLIDCFSTFCNKNAFWHSSNVLFKNENFMQEANFLKTIFQHYNLSKK